MSHKYTFTVVYCESVNLIGSITVEYLLIVNSYASVHIARCQPFSIGSWEAFKWPLLLWRGGCSRSSISFNFFFPPGEIGLLYALNDYDFYRLYKMYYSLSVGDFQEALEDLYCVEEIRGKSKFFLTLSLCLYILVRFFFFFSLDT